MELNEPVSNRVSAFNCECDENTAFCSGSQSDNDSLWSVNDESPDNVSWSVSNELSDDPSPVSLAAREGNVEDLCSLIPSGSPVDVADRRGWTALHEAAAHPTDVKCLTEILKHDSSDVNLCTYNSETALLIACKRKCGKVAEMAVDLLLFYGADANTADTNGVTPLLHATGNGEVNVVTRLLDSGCADPDLCNIAGCRPIHKAAKMGHLEILKCLLRANARVDDQKNYQQTPVHVAAEHGHSECLQELLQVLAERGQKEVIDSYSKCGSPLMIAASQGHTECLRLLLDHGASPNVNTLNMAIWGNHATCVKLLIGKMDLQSLIHPKSQHSPFKISSFALAFQEKYSECLGVLLSAGFQADGMYNAVSVSWNTLNLTSSVPFYNIQTTLSLAASLGYTKCMKVLLDNGANVNPVCYGSSNCDDALQKVSFPPVISALHSKTWEPLELLIKYGCDISYHRDSVPSNECLLFSFCSFESTKKLLLCGSDPHLCFQQGNINSQTYFIHHLSGDPTGRLPYWGPGRRQMNEDLTLSILKLLLEFTAITGPVKHIFLAVSRKCEEILDTQYNAEKWNAILQQIDKPSSLGNLCRIKIRQFLISLHGYSSFRRAIDHLDLPDMLKAYLQYKELCE